MKMACKNEYIVSVVTGYSKHIHLIKPISTTFESLKEEIVNKNPELKGRILDIFYYKYYTETKQKSIVHTSRNYNTYDKVLINTESDFKVFRKEREMNKGRLFVMKYMHMQNARSPLDKMLSPNSQSNSVIPSSDSRMETDDVYKICIVNNENDTVDRSVLIKPSPLNFDNFKETIFNRFPMFKNQPLHIFYKDMVGDKVIIGTASDFQFFLEQGVKKIFIVKNPQQNIWLNDADELSSKCDISNKELYERIEARFSSLVTSINKREKEFDETKNENEILNEALDEAKIEIVKLNKILKERNEDIDTIKKDLIAAKMKIKALKQEASNIDEIKKDLENAKNDLESLKMDLKKAENDTQNTSPIEENVFVASTSQTAHVPSTEVEAGIDDYLLNLNNSNITEDPEIIQKINCNETGKDISNLEIPSTKNNDNDESGVPAEDVNGTSTDEWTFIENNENAVGRSNNSSSTIADPEELTPSENTDKLDKIDDAGLSCMASTHIASSSQNAPSVQTQTENAAKTDTITQLPKPNDVFEMDVNQQLYNLLSSVPEKEVSVSNVSQSHLIETVVTAEDSPSADSIAGNSEESIPLIEQLSRIISTHIASNPSWMQFKEAAMKSQQQSEAQK